VQEGKEEGGGRREGGGRVGKGVRVSIGALGRERLGRWRSRKGVSWRGGERGKGDSRGVGGGGRRGRMEKWGARKEERGI